MNHVLGLDEGRVPTGRSTLGHLLAHCAAYREYPASANVIRWVAASVSYSNATRISNEGCVVQFTGKSVSSFGVVRCCCCG